MKKIAIVFKKILIIILIIIYLNFNHNYHNNDNIYNKIIYLIKKI